MIEKAESVKYCEIKPRNNMPAVHQSSLMVKGGGSDVTFQVSNPWASPNITTKQVPTKHITVDSNIWENVRDGFVS